MAWNLVFGAAALRSSNATAAWPAVGLARARRDHPTALRDQQQRRASLLPTSSRHCTGRLFRRAPRGPRQSGIPNSVLIPASLRASVRRPRIRAARAATEESSARCSRIDISFVADQWVLSLDATSPGTCRRRGVSFLQSLFRFHVPELWTRYEADFAKRLGKRHLDRICKAAGRFLEFGDLTKCIAGIRGHGIPWRFMHASRLPHRQFVFTVAMTLRRAIRIPLRSGAW